MKRLLPLLVVAAVLAVAPMAFAQRVVDVPAFGKQFTGLEYTGNYCADYSFKGEPVKKADPNCVDRVHPSWADPKKRMAKLADGSPAIIREGDLVRTDTRDCCDQEFRWSSPPLDATTSDPNKGGKAVPEMDLGFVHPLTGPIHIEGAKAGDALEIEIVDFEMDPFGYSIIIPNFGLIRDVFRGPWALRMQLTREGGSSPELPGVKIPTNAMNPGILMTSFDEKKQQEVLDREEALAAVGGYIFRPNPHLASPADVCGPGGSDFRRCMRTVPPRENGGNMDVRQQTRGTKVILPCYTDGCAFIQGDNHFSVGDGCFAGTSIENGGININRFRVIKGLGNKIKDTGPLMAGTGDALRNQAPTKWIGASGYAIKGKGVGVASGFPPSNPVGLTAEGRGDINEQFHFEPNEVTIGPPGDPPFVTPIDPYGRTPGKRMGAGSSQSLATFMNLQNIGESSTLSLRNAILNIIQRLQDAPFNLDPRSAYLLQSVVGEIHPGAQPDSPNTGVSAYFPLTVFESSITAKLKTDPQYPGKLVAKGVLTPDDLRRLEEVKKLGRHAGVPTHAHLFNPSFHALCGLPKANS